MEPVTSLQLSRKLYETGLAETSCYEWITDSETGEWCVRECDFYDLFDGPAYCAGNERYPAYTVEELLTIIPEQVVISTSFNPESSEWSITTDKGVVVSESRVDALAECLIVLLLHRRQF